MSLPMRSVSKQERISGGHNEIDILDFNIADQPADGLRRNWRIAMPEKRGQCEEFAHKWTVCEQGGYIISNGTIPGTKCICEQMILIEKFCKECNHRSVVAVKIDSKAAKEYMGEDDEQG